eukprot:TRINITY_DN25693_c0_g1_i1.p1 TRINITY_DN25693_c0_g1~~TRINITY_DN25693_c0_g1_i1.p1  ORF type:complete len:233 (-),score=45.87 TRINITY_DN25693_c0_g1_i1:253-951(-)
MLRWDPSVNYSLKKRGRWKMLERVATAWQEHGLQLAEETFDIKIGDVGRVKPFPDRYDMVGHRTLYGNHGEIVRKINLAERPRYLSPRLKTWEEGDPTKVEVKKSKRGCPSTMRFSYKYTRERKDNEVCNKRIKRWTKKAKETQTKIPLRCHASDKYTRRVIHEHVSRIHKHKVWLWEQEVFWKDKHIFGCEELTSLDAVNEGEKNVRKEQTIFLKDAIIERKKKEGYEELK